MHKKYLPCKHHNYQFFHQTDCTDHSKTLEKKKFLKVFKHYIIYSLTYDLMCGAFSGNLGVTNFTNFSNFLNFSNFSNCSNFTNFFIKAFILDFKFFLFVLYLLRNDKYSENGIKEDTCNFPFFKFLEFQHLAIFLYSISIHPKGLSFCHKL